MEIIKNLSDLCEYFYADSPRELSRRLYKDTACGASISLHLEDGWIHNGDCNKVGDKYESKWNIPVETPLIGFTIQTIVEGSEAEVNSDEFVLPVDVVDVGAWMEEMESEASYLWKRDNLDHFCIFDPNGINGECFYIDVGWGEDWSKNVPDIPKNVKKRVNSWLKRIYTNSKEIELGESYRFGVKGWTIQKIEMLD